MPDELNISTDVDLSAFFGPSTDRPFDYRILEDSWKRTIKNIYYTVDDPSTQRSVRAPSGANVIYWLTSNFDVTSYVTSFFPFFDVYGDFDVFEIFGWLLKYTCTVHLRLSWDHLALPFRLLRRKANGCFVPNLLFIQPGIERQVFGSSICTE